MPEEEKKEMSNRRANASAPSDRTPQVYAVRKGRSGWTLSRRGLLAAAASAAVITKAARAECPTGGYPTRDMILALAISPDGRILASADSVGEVSLWALPDGAFLKSLSFGSYHFVQAVAFSPDGRLLAAGNREGQIRVWSLPDGELLKVIPAYSGNPDFTESGVTELGLGREGRMVSAGTNGIATIYQGKVQLWSLPDGVLERTLTERRCGRLGLSPDGQLFAFAEPDDNGFKIQLWSLGGDLKATLTGLQEYPSRIAISPDGQLLAVCQPPGVKLWSVPDKTLIAELPVQAVSINGLRISPDGRWLAAGLYCVDPPNTGVCPESQRGAIKLWSLPDGALRKTITLSDAVFGLAIAPDGERLASAFNHITLFSLPEGKPLPACFITREGSFPEAKLVEYTRNGVSYSLPCGSPLPTGAVCTCNCVDGTRSSGCGGYWYPN